MVESEKMGSLLMDDDVAESVTRKCDDMLKSTDKANECEDVEYLEKLYGKSSVSPTLLHKASIAGDRKVVNKIVTEKKASFENSETGHSALHWAALKGHTTIVRDLLNAGINPNSETKMKCTPLHFAAAEGYDEIVHELLKAGANPDPVSRLGSTPLMSAAYKGHESIINILLKKDIICDYRNKNGHTALDLASAQGHTEITKILGNFHLKNNIKSSENTVNDTHLNPLSSYSHSKRISFPVESKNNEEGVRDDEKGTRKTNIAI